MDEVEQLIRAYESQAASSVVSKLGVLIDLEGLRDPRIVPFLLRVLTDRRESTEVRIHVIKRLRNGRLLPEHRPLVADAILEVLSDRSNPDLRLQAALALAEFTDYRRGTDAGSAAWLWIRMSRSTFATRRSLRCNAPDPPRSASRYFASCRRTGCSAAPPEVSCRSGASNRTAFRRAIEVLPRRRYIDPAAKARSCSAIVRVPAHVLKSARA